jgi:AcrR family transcriptional regulator
MRKGDRTKARIERATVRLIGRSGVKAATIRAIAKEAGVTEGLLYRYFRNKGALISEVWRGCMIPMLEAKRRLVAERVNHDHFIGDWIQLSYRAFDDNRPAFSVLFLQQIPHLDKASTVLKNEQFDLFRSVLEEARGAGKLRWDDTFLATNLFAAQLLLIPRLVLTGQIDGPASRYLATMTTASRRLLFK